MKQKQKIQRQIHGQDAAHCVKAILATTGSIQTVHDEYAQLCNKVTSLQRVTTDTFVDMYKTVSKGDGTLDLEQVRKHNCLFE